MIARKAKSKSEEKRIKVQEEVVAEKFPMHEAAQKTTEREHVLSKDCWCEPEVIDYSQTGKRSRPRSSGTA